MKTPFDPFTNKAGVAPGVEELAKQGVKITGLPFGHQGVEMQAASDLKTNFDQGPQQPMIVNGAPRFSAPAAMPFGQPKAPAVAGPSMPFGVPNSLSRGAAPRGLGGVAPVPVGRSGSDPQRLAERMVRRRDPRGAQFLFGQAMQKDGQAFQREMFGVQQEAEGRRDTRNFDQGVQMFGMQQEAEGERDARNFDQGVQMFGMQQQAGDQRYDRERKDQLSDEQKKRGFTVQPLDPNDPSKGNAIVRGDGSLFNVLPGERPAPKASVQQIPGTGDYVPMFGNQQVSGAPLYQEQPGWSVKGTPKLAPKQDGGQVKPPDGIQYEKDDFGKITSAVYPALNAQGKWVLQRLDLDGDGVVSAAEQAAAGGGGVPKKSRFMESLTQR